MDEKVITIAVSFGRTIVGILSRPYETYRRIEREGNLWELVGIALLLSTYFASAALVKTASFRPFLLTRHFVVLAVAVLVTYLLTVFLFWTAGRLVGAKGTLRGLLLGWGYTLIPTLLWFLSTSLLYVLLPPPRTTSVYGLLFSVVYLLFSSTLLFWKVILGYLALRFGLKLDLGKITIVCVVVLPLLGAYSVLMYRLGIFRIPFL